MVLKRPKVAVIMAAYNAEATLPEAVGSVLASTLPAHLVIVDDVSRLQVSELLRETMEQHPGRITVLRAPINKGPSAARNQALAHIVEAGFEYAAVLDADDLSYEERFARQATFLDAHPAVAVVGTWGRAVDEHTLAVISNSTYPPATPAEIRRALCLDSCMINTSVMFRVAALNDMGSWDESMYTGEDYDLFCRLARRYDLANIPQHLVDYRLSSQGISLTGIKDQRMARLRVQLRHFPYRAHYWQAWAGVLKSAARILVPTAWVDNFKRVTNRQRVF